MFLRIYLNTMQNGWRSLLYLYIYDLSLRNGIFSRIWKRTVCVPIYKSGDKADIAYYRKISIICEPTKISEQKNINKNLCVCWKLYTSLQNKSINTNFYLWFFFNGNRLDAIFSGFIEKLIEKQKFFKSI